MPITRILHLSDLRNCGSPVLPDALREGAWNGLLDVIAEGGLVDLVALTGDVTPTGRHAEFSALTPFFVQTCARLGVGTDRLFVVPGDRDVDRLAAGRLAHQGQAAFWRWLTEDLRQPERKAPDALGYHDRVAIAGSQAHVEVFGLNSAWRSREHVDDGAAFLGCEQVNALLGATGVRPDAGMRVALVHHPPVALVDAEASASLLARSFDLVLCGHGPHAPISVLAEGGVRVLASGPLGGDPSVTSCCQLIQVETDTTGRPLGFAVHRWIWSGEAACWVRGAPEVPEARRGRLYWTPPPTASYPPRPARRARMATLDVALTSIFTSADELRRWLHMRVPEVSPDLPGGTSTLRELAFATQEVLRRVGLIDDDLLDALADFSPAHGPAVVELGDRLSTSRDHPPPASLAASASHVAPGAPQLDAGRMHPVREAQRRREDPGKAGVVARPVEVEAPSLRRRLLAGDVLVGRYALKAELGRGGFAIVWRARDTLERRDVALKLLHLHDALDQGRRERFFRGARAMQRLRHPATVRVLSSWDGELEQPFYVMELIEGANLHEAVVDGPGLDLASVVSIATTVGEALAEAHVLGMVHRDVKPANILLDAGGRAYLTDFDLVRGRDTTGGTRTGGMGTMLYAAPEVVQNGDGADARADIYGLGMTVLFMLFRRDLPYCEIVREPESILARIDCPVEVKRVLLRAIAWDREHRYADVLVFCADLQAASEEPRPILPRPTLAPAGRSARRSLLELGAFALVAVGLVAAVLVLGARPSAPEATMAAARTSDDRSVSLVPLVQPPTVDEPAGDESTDDEPAGQVPPVEAASVPPTSATSEAESVAPPPEAPPAKIPKLPSTGRPAGERPVAPIPLPDPEPTPAPAEPVLEVLPTAEHALPGLTAEAQEFRHDLRTMCKNEHNKGESVTLDLTVAQSGTVVNAKSIGSARDTELADCMEKTLRGKHLSPFSGAPQTFSVTYEICLTDRTDCRSLE